MSPTKKLVGLAKLTLQETGSSHWLELADLLGTCSTSRDGASELLKQAWASADRPDYRSKIACLAHPDDGAIFDRAREAKVGINDLLKIARGNAMFDGSNVITLSKDGRGGGNEQTPERRLRAAVQKVLLRATQDELDRDVVKRILLSALSKAFDEKHP